MLSSRSVLIQRDETLIVIPDCVKSELVVLMVMPVARRVDYQYLRLPKIMREIDIRELEQSC